MIVAAVVTYSEDVGSSLVVCDFLDDPRSHEEGCDEAQLRSPGEQHPPTADQQTADRPIPCLGPDLESDRSNSRVVSARGDWVERDAIGRRPRPSGTTESELDLGW